METKTKKECVGCDKTEDLEHCEGTMCHSCWLAELEEPNLDEE